MRFDLSSLRTPFANAGLPAQSLEVCAGLMGAWLDRHGTPYPEMMNPPTTQARTLEELVQSLLERPR